MTLHDVLKVVDALDMIEICYLDKTNRSKQFSDFEYYTLESMYGFSCREMLQRKAIMSHAAYGILKDYEVQYLTSNTVDYDYTVIRITLKIKEEMEK